MINHYAGIKNPAGPQPEETNDRELPKRTFCSWSIEVFSAQFWPRKKGAVLFISITAEHGEGGGADQAGITGDNTDKKRRARLNALRGFNCLLRARKTPYQ